MEDSESDYTRWLTTFDGGGEPQRCYIVGFEDRGSEPWTKEHGHLLEARTNKEMESPVEPPQRNAILMTPWL